MEGASQDCNTVLRITLPEIEAITQYIVRVELGELHINQI